MSFHVRISKGAQEDLERLLDQLAAVDYTTALPARTAIEWGYEFLAEMPFACRKADDANPFMRELLISFGDSGYVGLFEIEDRTTVTVLAVRQQREDDYY